MRPGLPLLEETGTFRGQCAELCGKDHGYMPIVVLKSSSQMPIRHGSTARQNDGAAQLVQTGELEL